MKQWQHISIREIYRYLGIHHNVNDPALSALTENGIERVGDCLAARYIAKEIPVLVDGATIRLGNLAFDSRSLCDHIQGCERVLLFAATLGSAVDRLLQRDMVIQPSLAVVEQAVAAAFMEAYADACCEELAVPFLAKGLYLRPRFSPGYGDFPLEVQRPLLDMLDAGKHIGLSATTSHMLTPVKSATAVIGISPNNSICYTGGCTHCGKKDCIFRKEENA